MTPASEPHRQEYAKCKAGFTCKDCGLFCMCGFDNTPPCHTSAPAAQERIDAAIRPSVLYFALRMEEKLRKHDSDRGVSGWNGYTDPDEQMYLFNRLKEEVAECEEELTRSINFLKQHPEERLLKTSDEVIDIANFAMMMYTAWGPKEHSKKMAEFLIDALLQAGDPK